MRVLITGASGGIGGAVAEKLRANGWEVISLQARFENSAELERELRGMKFNESGLDALILCAGVGNFDPFEAVSADEISRVLDINLKANLIITNALLPALKRTRGHIIGIASIEAMRHARFSALYSASKAGFRAFLLCLFEEYRKNLRVTCINPDMTKTAFFDALRFAPDDDERAYIEPGEIAECAYMALCTKSNVSEITIRPQIVRIKKKS